MFMVKKTLVDDSFQNTFVYQSRFNTLGFKKDKVADYVIGWKSKCFFESKLFLLYGSSSYLASNVLDAK